MNPPLKTWNRLLWGVVMTSRKDQPEGMLIGATWHRVTKAKYPGEPSQALLFRTRAKARQWCREKQIETSKHSPDWRFRPVRVRETIVVTTDL